MVPSVTLMAKRDALVAGRVLAVAPNRTPFATVSWPCRQHANSGSHLYALDTICPVITAMPMHTFGDYAFCHYANTSSSCKAKTQPPPHETSG